MDTVCKHAAADMRTSMHAKHLHDIRLQRAVDTSCTRNSMNLGETMKALLADYDTHLLPEASGTNVTIELHVQGITGISELTADFSLDVMYR